MRSIVDFNEDWVFWKENVDAGHIAMPEREKIRLPHTWNAVDGQDGGNDYYRGHCFYEKRFPCPEMKEGDRVWIEFAGVSATAQIMVNGEFLGKHDGGYSAFRFELTKVLKEENIIRVEVDNEVNDRVYPQKADFTFYGGIYRDVKLVILPRAHFALKEEGASGIRVTPKLMDGKAVVTVETWVEGTARGSVRVTMEPVIYVNQSVENSMSYKSGYTESGDADFERGGIMGEICAVIPLDGQTGERKLTTELVVENPHLWQGREDPFLYQVKAELWEEELKDTISTKCGLRTFSVDPDKGFFLNGKSYPLRGVSRHQDREGVGNALTKEMHLEDMELIARMGANSIRLAHYQHDQYFYDLCDEYGMVVWAEIPYITRHMENGRDNTLQQMRELILQNYNHASICFWGISNEVSAGGLGDEVLENNYALEKLVKEMDNTRLTTMACAFMLDDKSPMLKITDTVAYNHYFGWYMGEVEDNDEWFDNFHRNHPEISVGLSEYGAEAVLKWQTGKPEKGDYTESYQALYHEHMLKMIEERPYLWCTYVWNMFDFAADARDEGGVRGRNNKGLVTFDREILKDAYYLYKAYWSKEAFAYLAGRRYVNRAENISEIKVYSNQEKVTLYQNGKLVGEQVGSRIFRFSVNLEEENVIQVYAGDSGVQFAAILQNSENVSAEIADQMTIYRVQTPDPSYSMPVTKDVSNWLDGVETTIREGYFSLEDKVGELVKVPEGQSLFREFMASYDKKKQGVAASVKMTEEQRMMTMRSMKLKELMRRTNTSPEEVQSLAEKLKEIRKPE